MVIWVHLMPPLPLRASQTCQSEVFMRFLEAQCPQVLIKRSQQMLMALRMDGLDIPKVNRTNRNSLSLQQTSYYYNTLVLVLPLSLPLQSVVIMPSAMASLLKPSLLRESCLLKLQLLQNHGVESGGALAHM